MAKMDLAMQTILTSFRLEGEAISCLPYGEGHVNATYVVVTNRGKRYILQKISTRAFHRVDWLMENIVGVTEFIRKKIDDPRCAMRVVPTVDNGYWLERNGEFWRIYDFVEDTVCLQTPETDRDFYESAVGFGTFQNLLTDYPAHQLHETIPNFHNTPDRYRIFQEVLRQDPMHRAKEVGREIDFVLSLQQEMGTLQAMRESGALPLRVTHNDTKINNVMLDATTRKAVCVVDLDTVMPGLSVYDFGDSIRFGAATAPEDEQNLERMTIHLGRYETFTRGFVSVCNGLTPTEIAMLPMGAKTMTMECGVRFLTDYLEGDHYFSIHREKQNLDRARTQFRLVTEMERNWDAMRRIVENVR